MILAIKQIVDDVYERALGYGYPRNKRDETVEALLEIIK